MNSDSAATTEREATSGEQALYNTLHKALDAIRADEKDGAENAVLDALDGLTGYCARRCRMFPDVHVRFKDDP